MLALRALLRPRVVALAPRGVRCFSAPLGSGWEQHEDDDGTSYYHNRKTGVTQWERPGGDGVPPPRTPKPDVFGSGRVEKFPRRDIFEGAEKSYQGRGDDFGDNRGSGGYGNDRQSSSRNSFAGDGLQKPDFEGVLPVVKAFTTPHPAVAARSETEITKWLADENVTVSKSVKPLLSFEEAWSDQTAGDNGEHFLKQLRNIFGPTGTPSQIQSVAWAVALSGSDMVGVAQTGCGKTLAYMLPGLLQAMSQPKCTGPQLLVLAPTRELACQIVDAATPFTKSICAVYGGARKDAQVRALRQGKQVVVATPGRLLDLLQQGVFSLKNVSCLVLDEADRMLDMGFEPQIRQVQTQLRADRQTLFFSATWPREIRRLARDLAREDPILVQVGNTELQINPDITQEIRVLEEDAKMRQLLSLVDEHSDERFLIFTETKRKADALCRELRAEKVNAGAIHGDKSQDQRDHVLDTFKRGKTRVLVATDVAQRGLDIKDIKFVVNYDRPKTIEDYTHRIGRTARGGSKGTAITYMTPNRATDNRRMAKEICEAMVSVGQKPPQNLRELGRH